MRAQGDAQVLVMMSPLWAAMAGFLVLGEPWRFPEFCATMVSLFGACLVAKPSIIFGQQSAPVSAIGVIFAISSSVSAASAFICVRILGTTAKMPWANVCLAQALGQIGLSAVILPLTRQGVDFHLSRYHACLVLGGAFVGAWSQIAMTVGMQREKSATATAMRMSDVAFAFLWQTIFTSDDANLLSVCGALLVTSSILIIVVFKKRTPALGDANEVEGGPPLQPRRTIELASIKAAIFHRKLSQSTWNHGSRSAGGGGRQNYAQVSGAEEMDPLDGV
jgi:drug/metabolite transporter (DMT)-like permease